MEDITIDISIWFSEQINLDK